MIQVPVIGKILLGILYISIAVAFVATAMFVVPNKNLRHMPVSLGGVGLTAVIADTAELRALGLGGYTRLKENEGMLFVFEDADIHGFWMKDTLFPIDIIWIDEDKKIVDVWKNATPESYPETRVPRRPAKYVLEVNAGLYEKYRLKVGDVLELETATGYNK